MNRGRRSALCAAALLLLGAGPARGEAAIGVNDAWTASIVFENDLFGDTDAQYTNGIQVAWVSPDLSSFAEDRSRLPKWSLPLVERLPFINEPGLQRNVAFSIGQKMFTPRDTARTDLVVDDRPYAGWLYLGAAFHNKNVRRLDTFEIQAGVVGPASLAEEAQNLVHDLRDFDRARGWDNQIENEPGLLLIYEHKRRLWEQRIVRRMGFDSIGHLGMTVGNVYVYGNAGMELRFGWNLPVDFGTSPIRPGGETNSPVDSSDPRLSRQFDFGAHVYAAITTRVIGRDLFLDGNTFRHSHKVDKHTVVADFLIGAAVTVGRAKLGYSQVFRSKEFSGQRHHHEFGSVSLSVTF